MNNKHKQSKSIRSYYCLWVFVVVSSHSCIQKKILKLTYNVKQNHFESVTVQRQEHVSFAVGLANTKNIATTTNTNNKSFV